VTHQAFHQPLSQAFAAMVFEDVNIAEISEGGGVRDDSRETDLSFPAKQGEAQRIGNGAFKCFSWNAL
jgi:hypothetical protein